VVEVGLIVLEHLPSVLVRASDGGLSVEKVDLLEGETLGLRDLIEKRSKDRVSIEAGRRGRKENDCLRGSK
jgi:hypothetical protein